MGERLRCGIDGDKPFDGTAGADQPPGGPEGQPDGGQHQPGGLPGGGLHQPPLRGTVVPQYAGGSVLCEQIPPQP